MDGSDLRSQIASSCHDHLLDFTRNLITSHVHLIPAWFLCMLASTQFSHCCLLSRIGLSQDGVSKDRVVQGWSCLTVDFSYTSPQSESSVNYSSCFGISVDQGLTRSHACGEQRLFLSAT
jgi:hypothetical protein